MNIRPVKDHASYQWALAEIEPYFVHEPVPGSPEADRFDVLAALIEVYETRLHISDEDGPAREVVQSAIEKHVAEAIEPTTADIPSQPMELNGDISADRALVLGQLVEDACKTGSGLPDDLRWRVLGRFAYGCAVDEALRMRGFEVN